MERMSEPTSLRALLAARKPLIGCALDSAWPAFTELAGLRGFDVVWGDLEHINTNPREAENFCRSAVAGGAIPLLRIAGQTRSDIMRALDAGARIVVVPMVNTPEQAREVARWGKFPPVGERGFHGATRGMKYGIGEKLPNMAWANHENLLLVQIESAEAVDRCAEIIATEGIDGGLVGPADMSISMGKPLAFDDTEVQAAFRRSLRAIRAAGKLSATAVMHPGLMRIAVEEGVNILVCAVDTVGLDDYFQSRLEAARRIVDGA